MKYFAWAGLALGLLVVVPSALVGQQEGPPARIELGQNYPNPFNPETTIPFTLPASLFDGGHRPVVSLRIYNVLAQLVAVPILQGSGEPMTNLALDWNGTGAFTAYWDGRVQGTGEEAPSGVYVYQLVVDGQRQTNKMTIIK